MWFVSFVLTLTSFCIAFCSVSSEGASAPGAHLEADYGRLEVH